MKPFFSSSLIVSALYDACRESRSADGLSPHVVEHLPKKVTSYLQLLPSLPVVSARR